MTSRVRCGQRQPTDKAEGFLGGGGGTEGGVVVVVFT